MTSERAEPHRNMVTKPDSRWATTVQPGEHVGSRTQTGTKINNERKCQRHGKWTTRPKRGDNQEPVCQRHVCYQNNQIPGIFVHIHCCCVWSKHDKLFVHPPVPPFSREARTMTSHHVHFVFMQLPLTCRKISWFHGLPRKSQRWNSVRNYFSRECLVCLRSHLQPQYKRNYGATRLLQTSRHPVVLFYLIFWRPSMIG